MQTLLKAIDLTKRFGGLTAVDHASLDIHVGEVVGLVGDNGAGKSTLIKMISGVYQPNDGEIFFEDKKVAFSGPRAARDLGIETIYQDLALAENLDVGSNIFLGREIKNHYLGGVVNTLNRTKMREESAAVLDRLDIRIPSLTQQIRNLSGGQRQTVAIARTIYWNAKLVIMDEPTAALGVPEQRKVLKLVRTICEQGVPVIIISHNMQDVFAVADRIVVMRRGKKVGELIAAKTTPDEVVSLMVGAEAVHEMGILPKALNGANGTAT
ncbi:MAG: ATP-binding cassette domain-containing protein [Chloroflexi bacterium]|nr:ATP-binding cassette domain-containing protein [Chloroflexota bacterium]MCL5951200.1 ATP-binding cassette domain-containing protein [Chloroflexota bacterium]